MFESSVEDFDNTVEETDLFEERVEEEVEEEEEGGGGEDEREREGEEE
jgi:hypothetical protein